jgi:D-apionolactonase
MFGRPLLIGRRAETQAEPLMIHAPITVQLGPFTVLFANGDLRYLRLGDVELIRRIYCAVREPSWGTLPRNISDVEFSQQVDGWAIRFRCEQREGPIDFAWLGRIDAQVQAREGQGTVVTIRYEMVGTAQSTFLTSRTGLCVLHPIKESAGRFCEVGHSDRSTESTSFPLLIAPHQPFFDVQSIAHEPIDGLKVEVQFEGEVFETEDQRNWADTSFKTYGRPLARPFPYELATGDEVRQAVTIKITGPRLQQAQPAVRQSLSLGLGEATESGRLPELGLSISNDPEADQQSYDELSRVASYLRSDVWLAKPDLPSRLSALASRSNQAGLPLELALHLPTACKPAGSMLDALKGFDASRVIRWLLLVDGDPITPRPVAEHLRSILQELNPATFIGIGSYDHFTELNRNRPSVQFFDFLSYPICPQNHSADEHSIIENLGAMRDQVATARAFCPNVNLSIGPTRFHRPRTALSQSGIKQHDDRQSTELGAVWLLGAISRLAEAEAESVTLYNAFGPDGARSGTKLFPSWQLLQTIRPFAGAIPFTINGGDPLRCTTLGLIEGKEARLFVGNLTNEEQTIALTGSLNRFVNTSRIGSGEHSFVQGQTSSTLRLAPYQIAVLDGDSDSVASGSNPISALA